MENKTQSRKWTLVINNPLEAGLDHDAISELLHRCSPAYFCMADEIAKTGTPHTHIFLYAPSPVRFSTLKNRFPTAHIEKAYGSAKTREECEEKLAELIAQMNAEIAAEKERLRAEQSA